MSIEPSYRTQVLNEARYIATCAGAGALSGHALNIVNPVGGAIFGTITALFCRAGDKIAQVAGINVLPGNLRIFCLIASYPVSADATTAIGFPVTVLSGAYLTVALTVSKYVIDCVIEGVKREGLFAFADHIARFAAAGALAGYALSVISSINPVVGAIFASTAALFRMRLGEKAGADVGSLKTFNLLLSIPVGAIASTVLGGSAPVTQFGAAGLTLAMLVSKYAIDEGISGAKRAGAYVASGAVAVKQRFC
jgi:hypothetical protein